MFDEAAARAALEARQQLRREAQLPLLDIEAELTAMREQAEQASAARAFADWKADNADLVKAIREEALNELRVRGNRPPDWRPTGVLSGGGLSFHLMVEKRVREAFEESMARASRFIWGPDDLEHH
jgi:hypothetical protein